MRVFFIGCVSFSHTCLQTLITLASTMRPSSSSTGLEIVGVATKQSSSFNADFCDLAPLAKQHAIPYIYAPEINAPQSLEFIRSCVPDVIYCFGWSALIKEEILNAYPVIGYHPAALPQNRGRHPIIWALALGLKRSASSFFVMDSGADSGALLSQVGFEIAFEDNAKSLCEKVEIIAQEQICHFSGQIIARYDETLSSTRERSERESHLAGGGGRDRFSLLFRNLSPYPIPNGSSTRSLHCQPLAKARCA